MKKITEPEVRVVKLEKVDIIATSGEGGATLSSGQKSDTQTFTTGWSTK